MSKKKTVPTEEHHIKFFDALIENDGKMAAAAEAAGMSKSNAGNTMKRYREYWNERVETSLSMLGLKAVGVMGEALEKGTEVTKLNLDASQQVLDRMGVTKRERVEVTVESEHGLFILPRKDIDRDNEKA